MLKLGELHLAQFFSVPLYIIVLNSNNAYHLHRLEKRVCLVGMSRAHKQLHGYG